MKFLKISIAGVRGIVGEGMTAEVAIDFAQAFATYLEGGSVAIGRDSRPSGPMLHSAVATGLLACGSRVVDLGIVPSPSLQIYMQKLRAEGAVLIAAGHNPAGWNALKFLREDGAYLNSLQGVELLEIYNHGEFLKARWDGIRPLEVDDGSMDYHRERVLQHFDTAAIRQRHFKVAVDCCNGPCSLIAPRLLEDLGCEVIPIHTETSRPFPHYPNPTPDNMAQLEALVKAARADIGFAYDLEGERLGIVTDRGAGLRQEYTFAIACLIALQRLRTRGADSFRSKKRKLLRTEPVIVTNLSTSTMIDILAQEAGAAVRRTPIGQAHVAEAAQQSEALVAGEGSGQVILPALHPSPDGLAATVLILEHLAQTEKTISQLAEQLPRFYMIKENLTLPANVLYSRLQQFRLQAEREANGWEMDLTDGVRIEAPDGWVHVRASNTEPLLRIIAEAREEARAKELHRWAREKVLS